MASPHIAGAMALLWSAIPSFQHQIQPSRDALNNSAVFISSTLCGTAGPPNNVFGWGRIDIAAAVGTPAPTPTVSPTPASSATPCGPVNANAYTPSDASNSLRLQPTATATATVHRHATPTHTARLDHLRLHRRQLPTPTLRPGQHQGLVRLRILGREDRLKG